MAAVPGVYYQPNYIDPTVSGSTLQGNAQTLQGTSPVIQGSSPNLQGGGSVNGDATYMAPPPDNTNTINNTFAAPMTNYASLYADLDRQNAFNQQQVDNQYMQNYTGLNDNYGIGNANLDRSQAGVDYTRSTGLRQLGDNIGANMQARLAQIGSLGGGSSSAGYGLSMALHGIESQNRGSLMDQAGVQEGDINLQRTNMKKQFDGAISQLDNWKASQIAQIANDYQNQKSTLDREAAGADATRQAAIAQQSIQLAQTAAAQLAQTQALHQQAIAQMGIQNTNISDANKGLANYNHTVTALQGTDPSIQYQGADRPVSTGYAPVVYKRPDQTY